MKIKNDEVKIKKLDPLTKAIRLQNVVMAAENPPFIPFWNFIVTLNAHTLP